MQGVKLVRDKFTEMLSSGAIQGPAAPDNLKSHNFKLPFFNYGRPFTGPSFFLWLYRQKPAIGQRLPGNDQQLNIILSTYKLLYKY